MVVLRVAVLHRFYCICYFLLYCEVESKIHFTNIFKNELTTCFKMNASFLNGSKCRKYFFKCVTTTTRSRVHHTTRFRMAKVVKPVITLHNDYLLTNILKNLIYSFPNYFIGRMVRDRALCNGHIFLVHVNNLVIQPSKFLFQNISI